MTVQIRLPGGSGHSPEGMLVNELERLVEACPGLEGAALASTDGLALAATGALHPDILSATCTFLMEQMNSHLGRLRIGLAREVLVWTDAGPWYFSVIGHLPCLLALHAAPGVPAGLLRHAGALGSARMAELLPALTEQ